MKQMMPLQWLLEMGVPRCPPITSSEAEIEAVGDRSLRRSH
jgi:hypothetical protein